MTKNMTLSIDDELAKKMDEMSEVNWSKVARNAIAEYIEKRMKPEFAPIIEKFSNEKKKQYELGVESAKTLSNKLSYEDLTELYDEIEYDYNKKPEKKSSEEKRITTLVSNLDYLNFLNVKNKSKDFKRGIYDVFSAIEMGLRD